MWQAVAAEYSKATGPGERLELGLGLTFADLYKRPHDRFEVEQIEQAADTVIWCSDAAPGFTPGRPQDRAYVGNIVEAMQAHGLGSSGDGGIKLADATRLIAISSDAMMAEEAGANP